VAGYADPHSTLSQRIFWADGDLKLGDEVVVRVVESESADSGEVQNEWGEDVSLEFSLQTCLFCGKEKASLPARAAQRGRLPRLDGPWVAFQAKSLRAHQMASAALRCRHALHTARSTAPAGPPRSNDRIHASTDHGSPPMRIAHPVTKRTTPKLGSFGKNVETAANA